MLQLDGYLGVECKVFWQQNKGVKLNTFIVANIMFFVGISYLNFRQPNFYS